jgi:hypothetical protein
MVVAFPEESVVGGRIQSHEITRIAWSIHKALLEFEQRYLPDLPMAVVNEVDLPNLEALERWRASTKEARRVETGWLET